MKLIYTFLLLFFLMSLTNLQAQAQDLSKKKFSRADTLRGQQSPERTGYDIHYYHLDIRVNPADKSISGSNLFQFTATRDLSKLQFDLFENMVIEKVVYKDKEIPFKREFNAVFIEFPEPIRKGVADEFVVFYSGYPIVAPNAPWDGGFVFKTDASGKPWLGVAVQKVGASLWWPNKDQQSDQVDSLLISIAVPDVLVDVSNGQFRGKEKLADGYTRYNWFVSYPINPYNVTVNIADYVHFKDEFVGEGGSLALDYYVLPESLEIAKKHFSANVPDMLRCFEYWFGPYPFYRDGYKLIESAYLGMEHQSAVAYGNQFKNGYLGRDISGTGFGLDWDFIIIHESGHEWFGNNITAKDITDSWIHEGFTTYSEALFAEYRHGKAAGEAYVKGLRLSIQNKAPLVGTYGVDDDGPGDIYNKGANIIQTIRTVINDDDLWRHILRGLNAEFGLKTVTTKDIVDYMSRMSGKNLTPIFNGYLNYAAIPSLEIRTDKGVTEYRWDSPEKDFDLPILIKFEKSSKWETVYPTTKWKALKNSQKFEVDTDRMYFNVKKL